MAEYRMKITQRGQMTIPAAIRRKLGLKTGGEVTIREADGAVVMEAPKFTVESVFGSVAPLKRRLSDREITDIAWEEQARRALSKGKRPR